MNELNQEEVNKIENEHNGYSLFTEIENPLLRAFNRCILTLNINEDAGRAVVKDYLENFSEKDRAAMFVMFGYIKQKGPDQVIKEINNNSIKLVETPREKRAS